MNKILSTLFLASIFMIGCSKSDRIEGILPDKSHDGETVYLLKSKEIDQPFTKIDSTTIKNGKFIFSQEDKGDTTSMAYIQLDTENKNLASQIPFVLEKGNIKIQIDTLINISGTPLNDTFQGFINEMRDFDRELDKLGVYDGNPDVSLIKKLYEKQTNEIYKFLQANIKNPLGEFLFYNYIDLLSIDQYNDLLTAIRPELQEKIKAATKNHLEEDGSSTFLNQKYINISALNPDNKKIALSDYVGKSKFVFVDFWASWCGPCINEMPNLVSVYNKYKDKGFEIVGVSLDEEKNSWTNAIQKLEMTWPQMSDLKGWNSELSRTYNVNAIPFTLLIDKNGIIIAVNLSSKELDNKLAELLK